MSQLRKNRNSYNKRLALNAKIRKLNLQVNNSDDIWQYKNDIWQQKKAALREFHINRKKNEQNE